MRNVARNATIVLLLLSVVVTVADGPAMLATNPPIYYEPTGDHATTVKDSDSLTFVPPDNASQIVSITPHDDDVEINIAATAVYTMAIAKDGAVRIVIEK